jgi:hypothetical protein
MGFSAPVLLLKEVQDKGRKVAVFALLHAVHALTVIAADACPGFPCSVEQLNANGRSVRWLWFGAVK